MADGQIGTHKIYSVILINETWSQWVCEADTVFSNYEYLEKYA